MMDAAHRSSLICVCIPSRKVLQRPESSLLFLFLQAGLKWHIIGFYIEIPPDERSGTLSSKSSLSSGPCIFLPWVVIQVDLLLHVGYLSHWKALEAIPPERHAPAALVAVQLARRLGNGHGGSIATLLSQSR